jgi:hypothetical protein
MTHRVVTRATFFSQLLCTVFIVGKFDLGDIGSEPRPKSSAPVSRPKEPLWK